MAEALARHYYGEELEASSAGLHPLGYIMDETLKVLTEIGVPVAGLYSKGLAEVPLQDMDLAVNLTRHQVSDALNPRFKGVMVHHPVVDPFGYDLETYRLIRDQIKELLSGAWSRLAKGSPT
jgi:protein-tyrosine-phosphatase